MTNMNTTIAIAERDPIRRFKRSVNEFIQKRNYLTEHILPTLIEGRDFYLVNGKRSLSKAGAERLVAVHQLTARFTKDTDTLESFKDIPGLVAYRCILACNGKIVGEGRGSATLSVNQNDPNKTIKMAAKSAYIDSVIRTTCVSDTFTQDLESMDTSLIDNKQDNSIQTIEHDVQDQPMTDKQRKYLFQLVNGKALNDHEREQYFEEINGCTSKRDASDLIDSLLK